MEQTFNDAIDQVYSSGDQFHLPMWIAILCLLSSVVSYLIMIRRSRSTTLFLFSISIFIAMMLIYLFIYAWSINSDFNSFYAMKVLIVSIFQAVCLGILLGTVIRVITLGMKVSSGSKMSVTVHGFGLAVLPAIFYLIFASYLAGSIF